jgi:hypothetical protein
MSHLGVVSAQWAGRCSNPRLLIFSQALHPLSYRPNKKTRHLCDTGFIGFPGVQDQMLQAQRMHQELIRRITGVTSYALRFAHTILSKQCHDRFCLLERDAGDFVPSIFSITIVLDHNCLKLVHKTFQICHKCPGESIRSNPANADKATIPCPLNLEKDSGKIEILTACKDNR